jgi:hypothetical protein
MELETPGARALRATAGACVASIAIFCGPVRSAPLAPPARQTPRASAPWSWLRASAQTARLRAYRELWQRGVRAPVPRSPDQQPGHCIEVRAPAVLACNERLTVCYETRADGGNGMALDYTVLGVGARGTKPFESGYALQIPYAVRGWISSKTCSYAWGFRPEWQAPLVRRCADRGHAEEDCEHAVRDVLTAATENGSVEAEAAAHARKLAALNPAEIARGRRDGEACHARRRAEEAANSGTLCVPIVYDPCERRVGIVCDTLRLTEDQTWWEAPGPAPHYEAFEYVLGVPTLTAP